jgi:hypothetical protein
MSGGGPLPVSSDLPGLIYTGIAQLILVLVEDVHTRWRCPVLGNLAQRVTRLYRVGFAERLSPPRFLA